MVAGGEHQCQSGKRGRREYSHVDLLAMSFDYVLNAAAGRGVVRTRAAGGESKAGIIRHHVTLSSAARATAPGPEPGSWPSVGLYHVMNHAAATMSAIPAALTRNWTAIRLESSTRMTCPANARNVPKQKIASECRPHRMSGRKTGRCSGRQSRGTNLIVMAASARK